MPIPAAGDFESFFHECFSFLQNTLLETLLLTCVKRMPLFLESPLNGPSVYLVWKVSREASIVRPWYLHSRPVLHCSPPQQPPFLFHWFARWNRCMYCRPSLMNGRDCDGKPREWPLGLLKKRERKNLSSHYDRFGIFHYSLENVKNSRLLHAFLISYRFSWNLILLCKEFSSSGSNMHEKHQQASRQLTLDSC